MSLPAENTGDYRVSIWSIHEESHARFVTVCAAASLTAIVLCLGFWNWNEWSWSYLYPLAKEISAAVGLSVAATWAAFNGVEAMGIALESYKKRQRMKGRAEGMAKGKAEGMAEGMAKGKAEGKAEGRAEGKAEGKAEGRAEERHRIREFVDSNGDSLTREQLLRLLDEPEDPQDPGRP